VHHAGHEHVISRGALLWDAVFRRRARCARSVHSRTQNLRFHVRLPSTDARGGGGSLLDPELRNLKRSAQPQRHRHVRMSTSSSRAVGSGLAGFMVLGVSNPVEPREPWLKGRLVTFSDREVVFDPSSTPVRQVWQLAGAVRLPSRRHSARSIAVWSGRVAIKGSVPNRVRECLREAGSQRRLPGSCCTPEANARLSVLLNGPSDYLKLQRNGDIGRIADSRMDKAPDHGSTTRDTGWIHCDSSAE
jgi:hypothetical protein